MADQTEEASYVAAAEKQIDRLVRASRTQRAILVVVGILIVLLGWVAWNQHQDSLATCRAGNAYHMSDDQIWNYFIGVLAAGNTKPDTEAKVRAVEGHIARLDAPSSCTSTWKLFG